MVPSPPSLGKIATVARNDYVEDGKRSYRVWIVRRDRERDRTTPVVANQMKFVEAEMTNDKGRDVGAECLLVIRARGPRRIAEPAQIRGNDRVLFRKARHHIPPFMRRLRNAVQQHHWFALTRPTIMQGYAFE